MEWGGWERWGVPRPKERGRKRGGVGVGRGGGGDHALLVSPARHLARYVGPAVLVLPHQLNELQTPLVSLLEMIRKEM
jgi:hypothetical protein